MNMHKLPLRQADDPNNAGAAGASVPDAGAPRDHEHNEAAEAALHRAAAARLEPQALPTSVQRRLEGLIDAGVFDAKSNAAETQPAPLAMKPITVSPRRSNAWLLLGIAALLALGTAVWGLQKAKERAEQLRGLKLELASLTEREASNKALLDAARMQVSSLQKDAQASAKRELAYAEQLANASAAQARLEAERDAAQLRIAALEAPVDPVELQKNRIKLLDVPGTVKLAWSPFKVEGLAPPEQPGLQGDVVWNDEMQTGYLRFVGLQPNDPNIEQYQVWVIDERGLEQKVSGGVFSVTAQGEIIVPIKPGIDVGRVALFAVTVEKPGGTWVPDLKRRLVVAPRT
jgi:hypothetical protein